MEPITNKPEINCHINLYGVPKSRPNVEKKIDVCSAFWSQSLFGIH